MCTNISISHTRAVQVKPQNEVNIVGLFTRNDKVQPSVTSDTQTREALKANREEIWLLEGGATGGSTWLVCPLMTGIAHVWGQSRDR